METDREVHDMGTEVRDRWSYRHSMVYMYINSEEYYSANMIDYFE